jgi:hypothetical protein
MRGGRLAQLCGEPYANVGSAIENLSANLEEWRPFPIAAPRCGGLLGLMQLPRDDLVGHEVFGINHLPFPITGVSFSDAGEYEIASWKVNLGHLALFLLEAPFKT